MKYWQEFQRFEYANELMLVVGGMFLFVAILQIVRSGLKMFFWVLIAALGAASASYGMQQGSYRLPGLDQLNGARLNELASNIDSDVLQYLCQKLDIAPESTEDPLQP